jgi:3-oxoacyl-[acyl-carrier protein] reductase
MGPVAALIAGLYSRVVTGSSSAPAALDGRVALVTGASGGIGAALCRSVSAAGATVAVGYGRGRDAAESLVRELANGGRRAAAFGADMGDPEAPARLVAEVEGELGSIDVLIANHGHARRATYDEVDADAFDLTLAVNLRAPFLLAQQVLGGMRERGFGRILFVSSLAVFRGGMVGPDYAASKAGLHGLTFFLASRVAHDGVTVNAIAPGFVETAMLPEEAAELATTVPIGRVGRPEEVSELALAMVTNAYLTGHVVPLDGGSHPR